MHVRADATYPFQEMDVLHVVPFLAQALDAPMHVPDAQRAVGDSLALGGQQERERFLEHRVLRADRDSHPLSTLGRLRIGRHLFPPRGAAERLNRFLAEWRPALPIVGQQQWTGIGMPLKGNAQHLGHLALVKGGAGDQVGHRRNAWRFVRQHETQGQSVVLPKVIQ